MLRTSIDVPGLHHGGMPIPQASRIGPLLVSSGVSGMDPATGTIPPTVDDQVAGLFDNVTRILDIAGGATGDIAKLTFHVRDRACRDAINKHWTAMFPDETARPARHTLISELPPSVEVQCEIIAFIAEETR
jgi:2-iminobutanoate/2-iminopropanoate deaminase